MESNILVDRSKLGVNETLKFRISGENEVQNGRIENIMYEGDDNHGEIEGVTVRTESGEIKRIDFTGNPTIDNVRLEHLEI